MSALQGPSTLRFALLAVLQRYKVFAVATSEAQGLRQKLLAQNLDCVFERTHFSHRSLIVKSQHIRVELVTRHAALQYKTRLGNRRRVFTGSKPKASFMLSATARSVCVPRAENTV